MKCVKTTEMLCFLGVVTVTHTPLCPPNGRPDAPGGGDGHVMFSRVQPGALKVPSKRLVASEDHKV